MSGEKLVLLIFSIFWAAFFVVFFVGKYRVFIRSSRIKKIAQKYNLSYKRFVNINRILSVDETKFNILSGKIRNFEFYYFDYINKSPKIDNIAVGKKIDKLDISPWRKSLNRRLLTNYSGAGIERVSHIKIDNKTKLVGSRSASSSMISDYSTQFCSLHLLEKILSDMESGVTEIFDELKKSNPRKFYFGTITWVKEVV